MVDAGFQLSEVDSNIVVFTFFTAMVLCVARSLRWPGLMCVLFLTWLYQHIDVSFYIVRNYFPSENPETVTVGLFLLSVGGLFCHMLRSKTRSRERILMFFAISSMSVVTLLFHYVTIETTLMGWQKDANFMNTQLLPRSEADFMEGCRNRNLLCYSGNSLEDFKPIVDDNLLETLARTDRESKTRSMNEPIYFQFSSLTGMYKKYFVVFSSEKGNVRVIIDEPSAILAHETSRLAFYYLATFAHAVWLIGVLFLIWFHRRFDVAADIR